jgi:hypothetical protein
MSNPRKIKLVATYIIITPFVPDYRVITYSRKALIINFINKV